MATASLQGYETSDPTVATTAFPDPTPTSSTSVVSSSTTASSGELTSPTVSPVYHQIIKDGNVADLTWTQFAHSNFDELCPSHDCVQDCQNYTRLFEEVPYLITEPFSTYGKSLNGQPPSITLFGVCSNLATVYEGISSNTDAASQQSYFPTSSVNETGGVSSTIASCLASTCDYSRESTNCISACNMTVLYSEGSTANVTAVTQCLSLLCGNTCGLPYANQDVMGVGVLVSYIIQAILVIACALALIVAAAIFLYRPTNPKSKLSETSQRGLEGFLAAQSYFTIALEIAALCAAPWRVDPLTGYALLSVAITGFLCPVFTLMLLHSHGYRSWYAALLTILSYILATSVFWSLFKNLSPHIGSTSSSDETLRELYQIPSCGYSSAIALCPQTIASDPLDYLAAFYNEGQIPNLKTMPILWGWSTLVLILLAVNQIYHSMAHDHQTSRSQSSRRSTWSLAHRIFGHPATLLLASILFGLSLGYQARMLLKYSKSAVIDWDGWSFGQVVAVVIWIQPVADYLHSWLREYMGKEGHPSEHGSPSTQQTNTQTKGGYSAVSQSQPSSLSTPRAAVNTFQLQRGSVHSRSSSSGIVQPTPYDHSPLPTRHTY